MGERYVLCGAPYPAPYTGWGPRYCELRTGHFGDHRWGYNYWVTDTVTQDTVTQDEKDIGPEAERG